MCPSSPPPLTHKGQSLPWDPRLSTWVVRVISCNVYPSSPCTLPARTKQCCYGNCKHQAILARALGSPAGREIMAFVVIYRMLMLSRLYPQALTRDTLTLHLKLSVVNFLCLWCRPEITSPARARAHYPDDNLGLYTFLTTSVGSSLLGDPEHSKKPAELSNLQSPTDWQIIQPVFLSFFPPSANKHVIPETAVTHALNWGWSRVVVRLTPAGTAHGTQNSGFFFFFPWDEYKLQPCKNTFNTKLRKVIETSLLVATFNNGSIYSIKHQQ